MLVNVAAGANIAAARDNALASRRTRTQTATTVCQCGAGFKTARLQTGEFSSVAGGKQYETDVAIVGAGGACMAAGIEALDAGARAVVFERASQLGGAAIISGGGCLIVGSPLQAEHGIHDTPDLAFKDWIEWGGPSADVIWARYYRAQPPRSLSLGRRPRREMGRHESPGGQLRAALDPAGTQRSWPYDRNHLRLPQARRRDRARDGDHGAQPRGRLRHRPARPQHQDRRGRGRQKQVRDRGDRRLQLESRDGAQV